MQNQQPIVVLVYLVLFFGALVPFFLIVSSSGSAGFIRVARALRRRRRWPLLTTAELLPWQRRLLSAGYQYPLPSGRWLIIGVVTSLIILGLWRGGWGILAGLVSVVGVWWWVKARSERTNRRLVAQLPDGLASLAQALQAGYALPRAVALLSSEVEKPLALVFQTLQRAEQLGFGFSQALRCTSLQLQIPEWTMVAETLQAQGTVGGNSLPLLSEIATTIRERVTLAEEVTTLTAPGRLSGWIIGLLAPLLMLIFFVVSPEYVAPLFTTVVGRSLLATAILLQAIGFVWIRHIIRIDY